MKPTIYVSRCLGFDACRYNGQKLSHSFVDLLKMHVDIKTVCPEVDMGMSIPRAPIRINVNHQKKKSLMQPSTNIDYTQKMSDFSDNFCASLKNIDGFILKSRSPSCGIRNTKLYSKEDIYLGKGSGLFAQKVLEVFPGLAIEDESRLGSQRFRDHFLMKIYTLARFRKVKESQSMSELMDFQKHHKLLFMAYNQSQAKVLGCILGSSPKERSMLDLIVEYERTLHLLFKNPARKVSHINALMHAMGYFSKQLKTTEKAFFLDQLQLFREDLCPLRSLLNLLESWIIRFDEKYLTQQIYFNPYPKELILNKA